MKLPMRAERAIKKAGQKAAEKYCEENGIDDPEDCPEEHVYELACAIYDANKLERDSWEAAAEDYHEDKLMFRDRG